MCVGRYAEKMKLSEAKWNLFCMPAIDISGCCIPAECNNIKLPYNGEIASRWDAYLLCDICRHFASVISHNLRCIPAYAHQIPTGFIQSLLNNHRDNLYIISQIIVWLGFVEFSIQIVKNTYSSLNFN